MKTGSLGWVEVECLARAKLAVVEDRDEDGPVRERGKRIEEGDDADEEVKSRVEDRS
jgi:hypothetical protein